MPAGDGRAERRRHCRARIDHQRQKERNQKTMIRTAVDFLNLCGAKFLPYAASLLWQSSILILLLYAVDLASRKKLAPAVRYCLWSVLFIKLLLPPSLALPISVAWWLRSPQPAPPPPQTRFVLVTSLASD